MITFEVLVPFWMELEGPNSNQEANISRERQIEERKTITEMKKLH